ncbi:MAG: ABC transporter permease subunit [Rhizobiales bacterium]|nr:ABC transporter permease subunit [Hyphomicrobiales bacterium]
MVGNLFGQLSLGAGGWGDELLSGLGVTLKLCLVSLPCGLLLGLALAIAQGTHWALLREASSLLTAVLRGIPELLTLLLIFYGGQYALNAVTTSLGLGIVELSAFIAGVATLSLIFAAYSSEVFIGVLRAISRSSLEAAKALGLGRIPTLLHVILPELFRLSLPGLSNLWLSMVKQTALISIIGYGDLLREAYIAASSSGNKLYFYFFACLAYLAITQLSEYAAARVSGRLSRGLS